MVSKKQELYGMVDISNKASTARTATACAKIKMGPAYQILMSKGSPKGDVFETARVAGIMAAKATPAIIPLCHPLLLNKVNISFETAVKQSMITVTAEVKSDGKTGVEMEALTAACAAALTIYDMMKWADHAIIISEIKLIEKQGGQGGVFRQKL